MARVDPGSIQFKFMVNGVVKAGQVNMTADLLPVFKAIGNSQINAVNFQTAAGGVTPPPPDPVAPTNTTPPVVTPASGTVGTLFSAASGTWTGTPSPHLTGRWQRNGSDIVGATAYTYTSVEDDVGTDSLTFVEHGTNTAGSADASSNPVTVTEASADVPIANQAALIAMLAAGAGSSGGKSYLLAPGTYTQSGMWTYDYSSSPIIIKGQAGVSFNYLALNTCKGISLFGQGAQITSLYNGQYGVYAISSVGLTFDGFSIPGNNPGASHTGVGFFIRLSDQITITNNTMAQLGAGITGLDCTNCISSSNHVTKISANPILWLSTKGITIEKNFVGPLEFVPTGTHSNYIHIAQTGTTGNSTNVVVRYNNCEQPPGTASNGFILGFEGCDGVTVVSNCGFDGGANGITFSGCTQVVASDNFMQGYSGSPRIYCRGGSDNVTMTNNFCQIAPFSLHQPPEPDSTNVTISGNTLIPQATGANDTSRRDAYLAARPNIPTS